MKFHKIDLRVHSTDPHVRLMNTCLAFTAESLPVSRFSAAYHFCFRQFQLFRLTMNDAWMPLRLFSAHAYRIWRLVWFSFSSKRTYHSNGFLTLRGILACSLFVSLFGLNSSFIRSMHKSTKYSSRGAHFTVSPHLCNQRHRQRIDWNSFARPKKQIREKAKTMAERKMMCSIADDTNRVTSTPTKWVQKWNKSIFGIGRDVHTE